MIIVATATGAAPQPLALVAPVRVLRLGPDDRRGGLTSGVPHGCARDKRGDRRGGPRAPPRS